MDDDDVFEHVVKALARRADQASTTKAAATEARSTKAASTKAASRPAGDDAAGTRATTIEGGTPVKAGRRASATKTATKRGADAKPKPKTSS